MVNYSAVDNYVKKVIFDACKAENRPNDVKYKFCIIEDNVVMDLKSNYLRVIRRIEYRLKNNLPKNFGLKYNEDFTLFHNLIDVNYTVDVFSENPLVTIVAHMSKKHLLPPYVRDDLLTEEGSKNGVEFLKLNDGKLPKTWEKYLQDYEAIYGVPHKTIAIWE